MFRPLIVSKVCTVGVINAFISSSYGNLSSESFSDGAYRQFAKRFVVQYAPNILSVFLGQIVAISQHNLWMPDKVLYLIATFLVDCTRHKVTWNFLQPHVEMIVAQFAFPMMCFSTDDEELFEDDPVEYIHKKSGAQLLET